MASLSKKDGFTIIEVLVVLAIAGLIMLIVFLAIPQGQRMSRNERRRRAVGEVLTELQQYLANTYSGTYPDDDETDVMCRIVNKNLYGVIGKVDDCDESWGARTQDGYDCIGGDGDKYYTVCFVHANHFDDLHDYSGDHDVIIIQVAHPCVREDTPLPDYDLDGNPVVTSELEGTRNNRVVSVRTLLEKNMPFCQDFGLDANTPH